MELDLKEFKYSNIQTRVEWIKCANICSTEMDTSFFEVYFNLTFDHTSTSEVLKNEEKVLQKGVN